MPPPTGRRRWTVRAGDGRVVGEVLARAGVDGGAVGEGRVCVGRRRVIRADEPVREGDVIDVAATRDALGNVRVLATADDPQTIADAIVRVHEAGLALRESTAGWFAENGERLSLESSLRKVLASYEG